MSTRQRICNSILDVVDSITADDVRRIGHIGIGASIVLLVMAINDAMDGETITPADLVISAVSVLVVAVMFFATAWLMEGGDE